MWHTRYNDNDARVGLHGYVQFNKHTHRSCEYHAITWMAGPDCAVMYSLVNTHKNTHTHNTHVGMTIASGI